MFQSRIKQQPNFLENIKPVRSKNHSQVNQSSPTKVTSPDKNENRQIKLNNLTKDMLQQQQESKWLEDADILDTQEDSYNDDVGSLQLFNKSNKKGVTTKSFQQKSINQNKLQPLNNVKMNNYNTAAEQTPSNRATNPTLQKRRFMDCSNQSQQVNLHDHIANQSPDKTQAYVQKSQNYVEQHKLFNLQQMPDPQEDYNRSSAKKQFVKQNHSNRSSPQTSLKHQPKRLNGEAPQPKSNSQSSRKPGLKNAKSSDRKYKNIGNGSGRDEGSDNADELFITEYDGIQDDAIDKYLGNQFSSNQDIQVITLKPKHLQARDIN
eukprot:403340821